MSVIPQTVEFEHKVTWTIKNFDLRPRHHEQLLITSPEFDVRCLDVTTWSFVLYPNGSTQRNNVQFAVRLHYSGSRDVSELHVLLVKFVVYLVDGGASQRFRKESFFRPSFAEPTSSPTNLVPLAELEDERLLTNGALVVVCELTTRVDQVEFLSSVYSDQMVSLGSKLAEMLEHPLSSDMIAYSRDMVPFDVHVCIMKARCPILFSDSPDPVTATPRGYVWSSSVSTETLKALLFYIYGRTTIRVQDINKSELMLIAIRYGLLDLERKLREYPEDLAVTTDIVVEDMTLDYPLRDLEWVAEARPRFKFLPTRNLKVPDLVVSFQTTAASEDADAHLKIGFRFSDFDAGVPILLRCTLCLLDDGGRVLERREHWNTFSNDEEWTPPPFVTRASCRRHGPHALRCDARLTETSTKGRVSSNACRVGPGRCVLFNNFLLIGDDLLKMYMKQVNCDLKVKVEEFEFLCHKSFLARRSRTIRKKVEYAERAMAEDSSDMVEIRLNDVAFETCHMVMLYMYSGRIDINDSDEAKSLGKAASYFHLPLLLEKSFFFKSG